MNRLHLCAIVAACGIILGAFGAHALEARLEANGYMSTWETAVLYHLVHAIALFVVSCNATLRSKWAYRLWFAGILLFSGSLYLLALGQWKFLGPITPLGGLAFIGGWIAIALENRSPSSAS